MPATGRPGWMPATGDGHAGWSHPWRRPGTPGPQGHRGSTALRASSPRSAVREARAATGGGRRLRGPAEDGGDGVAVGAAWGGRGQEVRGARPRAVMSATAGWQWLGAAGASGEGRGRRRRQERHGGAMLCPGEASAWGKTATAWGGPSSPNGHGGHGLDLPPEDELGLGMGLARAGEG